MTKEYYIYILRCDDNSLYTGITTDIIRRFSEHSAKNGAKYTKSHNPLKIEALWKTYSGRSVASKFEYKLKKLTKKQKEALISNPSQIHETYQESDITVVSLNL